MTPKRTIVVAIAVVVGVAASVLSYVFLNNAQTRAYHNAKLVQAYVVVKPVPRTLNGTDAINDGYIQHKKIPEEFRPTSAISNLSSIEGKEAVAPFSVGQVLVSSMFESASSTGNSFSQTIPAGDVAVTVSLDQVHGVANFPVAGDKVDLLVNLAGTESVLLQNVSILAIGSVSTQPTVASSGQTANTVPASNAGGLVTFDVSPTDASKIALSEQNGLGLYMTLLPPNSTQSNIPPVSSGDISSAP
jgi:Flp pilus assembly protein CpaB